MGKIAGVIVVQMMIMSSLYTEGKPQDVTAEKAGCSHSAVKKHLYRKLTARENCGKSDRGDSRFERIVKKGWFKNLQELHKEWMEVSVTTQMSLGNEFQCQKCLFGLLLRSPLVRWKSIFQFFNTCLTGSGFESTVWPGIFCVEFACSLSVYEDSPTWLPRGSHSPKTCNYWG